ncbi:MAG: acyltransferase, partial [Solirubrobacterales bacterium]
MSLIDRQIAGGGTNLELQSRSGVTDAPQGARHGSATAASPDAFPVPSSATAADVTASTRATAIDGLRGLAALAVLVFHVWLFGDSHSTVVRDSPLDVVFASLKLGLYMFFALSAFLLVRPFLRAALGGGEAPKLGRYVVHRAARVAPAYYVSLAGSAILLWLAADGVGAHLPKPADTWTFLIFAQNFRPETLMKLNPSTWSLPIELGFYALVPLIGATAIAAARNTSRIAVVGNKISPRLAVAKNTSGTADESLTIAAAENTSGIATAGVCRTLVVIATAGLAIAMIVTGLWWNAQTIGAGSVARLSLVAMLPYFACGLLAALVVETLEAETTITHTPAPAIT